MPRVKRFDEQQILEKAMHLFWEKGFYATSIQDLVNHLGINRASLYDTYGGKQELFDRAIRQYIKSSTTELNQFLTTQTNVKTGFRNLFRGAIKESLSAQKRKGCFVVNTTTELVPNDNRILEVIQENKKNIERIFTSFLKSGIEKDQIAKDKKIDTLPPLLFSFYVGLRVVTKMNAQQEELFNSVDAFLTILD